MSKLVWDKVGERYFETGVDHGVLFTYNASQNKYNTGVAWNGLTSVDQSPSGAEANPQYADNIKYVELRSAEDFGATIECFTYPKEFEACDGHAELANGIIIGQQARQMFAMAYRTRIGNDTELDNHGYKLHVVYGATVSPSSKNYQTVNDNPELVNFSYELTTVPVEVAGYRPTAHLEIDSRYCDADVLKTIEESLFGSETKDSTLLMPAGILALIDPADPADPEEPSNP